MGSIDLDMFSSRNRPVYDAEWRKSFESEAAALIRAGDFEKTQTFLINTAKASPFSAPLKKAAKRRSPLWGFDLICADLLRIMNDGVQITALGLDLDGYGDGTAPVLTPSYYSDEAFAFSGDIDSVIEEAGKSAPAWNGATAAYAENAMHLENLDAVYAAIQDYDGTVTHPRGDDPLPAGYHGYLAAIWFIYFRAHHEVSLTLQKEGLPFPAKVIVGQHGFGPEFSHVYAATATAKSAKRGDEVISRQRQKRDRDFDFKTIDLVHEYKKRRRTVRNWKDDHNSEKLDLYKQYVRAAMRVDFQDIGLPLPAQEIWEMDDAAFKALIKEFKAARETARIRRNAA